MDKETKKPEVIVGKSALDEFLDEWNAWRGKSKAKKVERSIHEEEQLSTTDRIKRKRKQHTNFMDSGFMLVIKFFVGFVDFFVSIVVWMFSFVFSFKFIALVAAIIYWSDVEIKDIGKILGEHKVKEVIENVEEGAHGLIEEIQVNEVNQILDRIKDKLDGIIIKIETTDGEVIQFGTGPALGGGNNDDVDTWTTEDGTTRHIFKENEVPKDE